MTAVAGEVADGFLCHGFTTERYIREVTIPRLRSGADRSSNNVQLSVAPFVVTGRDEESMRAAAAAVRAQLAFYGSTPTYRPVLELHGWEALGDELSGLARRGDWDTMGDRIDDEVLSTFAVVAEPGDVATALLTRFGDIADRMALYLPYDAIDVLPGIVAGLTAAG
jgi:probable F420-dependent oxidoreductase